MQILLVDDDRDLVDVMGFALHRAGFSVLTAYDSPRALQLLQEESPELAIVDVNLGPWNGFELLKKLRRRSSIPIIMLSARDSEDDKILGLELGADDYVTKPFSHRELTARIRANLRRHGQDWAPAKPSEAVLQVGPISMNVAEHSATKGGKSVALTVTEFRLLHYLMINAGTAVPAHSILRHVWGYDHADGTDVLRVTVHRLRRKLEDDPNNPKLLHTIPGVGVLLKLELD